ncbi:MAG: glycosyltransferase family 2 protein [Salinivirgaceae bacterium]|nr:glycosyltransferase family 2 protein [Salinivirgaceae bacterium]
MKKLSAVIITLNEEKNIEKCIISIQDIADEIIVLDSFSTDATKEICQKYKVTFIEHEWRGYSGSKNLANSLASNNLVFCIDADEVVSQELLKSIQEVKNTDAGDAYYVINRITNFCGSWIKHCGWYPDKIIRIWNKNDGEWKGDIHEKLEFNKPLKKVLLHGDLHHFSFHTIEQHLDTINKFSGIAAKQKFKNGKKASLIRIVFKPFFKFLVLYFVKLGILDGYHGFIVCRNSAFSTYLKEIKLKELYKK